MSWWKEFADTVQVDAPIARMTWFRIGGCARFLASPRDAAELARFVVRAREEDVPYRVLGAGANVLVSDDGFDGAVIRLEAPAFRRVDRKGRVLQVGGGVDLMPLAKRSSQEGLSGLECMAGIPATVGGAVKMNAGGRLGEFGDVVRTVDILTPDGQRQLWKRERIGFGYRRSLVGDNIVLGATLELVEDDPVRTTKAFASCFDDKMQSQPIADRSAGCIFKNPPGQSAGALIDQAGLKGVSCGSARVSARHANFIVTGEDASASDVLRLIDLIRERVERRFGTVLELEVDVWRPQGVRNAA